MFCFFFLFFFLFKQTFTRANATPSFASDRSSTTRINARFNRVKAVRTAATSLPIRIPFGERVPEGINPSCFKLDTF
uniref:Putative secreted protein n=1 Tax=Rhipicephalus microplus TaxID=6941 RepID=A0A6M2DAP6_RHIMP